LENRKKVRNFAVLKVKSEKVKREGSSKRRQRTILSPLTRSPLTSKQAGGGDPVQIAANESNTMKNKERKTL
jgi:hypothetical protein